MTLIKTLKLYRQLSGPQKQFIANSGIQSKMSARQWIRFFEPLDYSDRLRHFGIPFFFYSTYAR